jgi:DNA-binding MarR family transcriptional regulator
MSTTPLVGPFIGSLCRVVWQWVREQIHTAVVAAGYDDLTPAHVSIFRYRSIEGMRPSDLADDMHITKQSVNELIGHLERQGYLVRERDPADSRSRRIRLTASGRELQAVTARAAEQAERDAAELIGAERMDELRRTLTDLASALERLGAGSPNRRGDVVGG